MNFKNLINICRSTQASVYLTTVVLASFLSGCGMLNDAKTWSKSVVRSLGSPGNNSEECSFKSLLIENLEAPLNCLEGKVLSNFSRVKGERESTLGDREVVSLVNDILLAKKIYKVTPEIVQLVFHLKFTFVGGEQQRLSVLDIQNFFALARNLLTVGKPNTDEFPEGVEPSINHLEFRRIVDELIRKIQSHNHRLWPSIQEKHILGLFNFAKLVMAAEQIEIENAFVKELDQEKISYLWKVLTVLLGDNATQKTSISFEKVLNFFRFVSLGFEYDDVSGFLISGSVPDYKKISEVDEKLSTAVLCFLSTDCKPMLKKSEFLSLLENHSGSLGANSKKERGKTESIAEFLGLSEKAINTLFQFKVNYVGGSSEVMLSQELSILTKRIVHSVFRVPYNLGDFKLDSFKQQVVYLQDAQALYTAAKLIERDQSQSHNAWQMAQLANTLLMAEAFIKTFDDNANGRIDTDRKSEVSELRGFLSLGTNAIRFLGSLGALLQDSETTLKNQIEAFKGQKDNLQKIFSNAQLFNLILAYGDNAFSTSQNDGALNAIELAETILLLNRFGEFNSNFSIGSVQFTSPVRALQRHQEEDEKSFSEKLAKFYYRIGALDLTLNYLRFYFAKEFREFHFYWELVILAITQDPKYILSSIYKNTNDLSETESYFLNRYQKTIFNVWEMDLFDSTTAMSNRLVFIVFLDLVRSIQNDTNFKASSDRVSEEVLDVYGQKLKHQKIRFSDIEAFFSNRLNLSNLTFLDPKIRLALNFIDPKLRARVIASVLWNGPKMLELYREAVLNEKNTKGPQFWAQLAFATLTTQEEQGELSRFELFERALALGVLAQEALKK